LGDAHAVLGQPKEAGDRYTQALVIRRELNDPSEAGALLVKVAGARARADDPAAAILAADEALVACRERADLPGELCMSRLLGQLYASVGEHDRAQVSYSAALLLAARQGDRDAETGAVRGLAEAHAASGVMRSGRHALGRR
jgi:hypothetical protein